MSREKLIRQLFVGKVSEIIGYEETTKLLREQMVSIDEMLESAQSNNGRVFLVQGDNLLLHGCFSSRGKAEKYINGSPTLKIQELIVR